MKEANRNLNELVFIMLYIIIRLKGFIQNFPHIIAYFLVQNFLYLSYCNQQILNREVTELFIYLNYSRQNKG